MARYDDVAEWYVEVVSTWGPGVVHDALPDSIEGQRILDVGCGEGRLTRAVADRGAHATGLDVSPRLIEMARRREAAEPRGVRYVVADASDAAATENWWDGVAFDAVTCEMALMDIDDLQGAAAVIERVVRPGGWLLFSLFHPCFPGTETQHSSWPPGAAGYSGEGRWNTGADGIRGHVGSNHRMLSTYLNAFARRDFRLLELIEPPAPLPFFAVARFART